MRNEQAVTGRGAVHCVSESFNLCRKVFIRVFFLVSPSFCIGPVAVFDGFRGGRGNDNAGESKNRSFKRFGAVLMTWCLVEDRHSCTFPYVNTAYRRR